jgi:hypothetical protein
LTAEWRGVLAGLRPGGRPGGERHSRGGEGAAARTPACPATAVAVGRPPVPDNYAPYAAQVENLFLPAPMSALEEYGVPIQLAEKLVSALDPRVDSDGLRRSSEGLRGRDLGSLRPLNHAGFGHVSGGGGT